MDRLWTPWRYSYITRSDPQARTGVPAALADWPAAEDRHCVFCNIIAATDYATFTLTRWPPCPRTQPRR